LKLELINQWVELSPLNKSYVDVLESVCSAGRVCYQSEAKAYLGNDPVLRLADREKFIRMIIKKKHWSVLQHENLSFLLTTNRGITHELVRHELSFSQESTRYCTYSDTMKIVIPVWNQPFIPAGIYDEKQLNKLCHSINDEGSIIWLNMIQDSARYYELMLNLPTYNAQKAREALSHSVASQVRVTGTIRNLKFFLEARTSSAAHPQFIDLALDLQSKLRETYPVFFE
jgi:thymidylate synthase (FAD)